MMFIKPPWFWVLLFVFVFGDCHCPETKNQPGFPEIQLTQDITVRGDTAIVTLILELVEIV